MSIPESTTAIMLAKKVLDNCPPDDPDSNLAILSRQLMRALERLQSLDPEQQRVNAERISKDNTLAERVMAFNLLQLPGQPQMTHMGTHRLINDLWNMVQTHVNPTAV